MLRSTLIALAALIGAQVAQANDTLFKKSVTGAVPVKSIEALAFSPEGVLLIGDSKGAQIFAVDTADTKAVKWEKNEIKNIDQELAGRLGTNPKGINILGLAVNPASHKAYIAVRHLGDKKDVILTVDGAGKVEEFSLEKVTYVRIALPADDSAISKITDIAWAGDRVLAAVQAGGTFASRIFSIPVPLETDAKAAGFSAKTYHVAHSRWETNAPIRTLIPYVENGKKYLVGAFTCTPIVKYNLDELAPGARVEGVSLIELGSGNTPLDMFSYEKDGKNYILMNTTRFQKLFTPSKYWTVKVDQAILRETDKVNEKAARRGAKDATAQVVDTFHYVTNMDRLGRDQALVLRTDDQNGKHLAVLALP